jgi:hypothetical protein
MVPYTAQLDWAWRESDILTRHRRRGWSDSSSYPRKFESHKVTPRDLCKQEASILGVWSRRSCIFEGLAYEGREEVWGERKLPPRYIGPFSILEKCKTVAYKLNLSPSLAGVHNIFHVSQLKKWLKAPMDVVLPKVTPLEANFSCLKHGIKILDQKDRVTRRKTIKFFKIQWSNHTEEEATWESEDFLRSRQLDFILP